MDIDKLTYVLAIAEKLGKVLLNRGALFMKCWKKFLVCYNKNREIPDSGMSDLSAKLFNIEGKAGLPKLAFFRYMDNLLST